MKVTIDLRQIYALLGISTLKAIILTYTKILICNS